MNSLEKGPNSQAYPRAFYLLNGLALVKAFTLLPDDEDLIVHLFHTAFEIIYALRYIFVCYVYFICFTIKLSRRAVASSTPAVTAHLTDVLLSSLEDIQVSNEILDELFDFFITKGDVC